MKEEDKESIADLTSKKVLVALRAEKSFWVPEEEHYNHHKRLSGWYATVDRVSKQVGKAFVGFVLAGIVALIVFGYNKFKF